MKFISPKVHGIIDLMVVVFLLIAPSIFDFTVPITLFTYGLAVVHLLLTALTKYTIGIFKVIPFTVHSTIEFVVGVVLIALAYTLFNTNHDGKLFYIIFGTIILLTWLVTDYQGSTHKKRHS
jgi:hypothetical protein